jgi:hypothetical protein
MTIRFTIPASCLTRLAALRHATDDAGAIAHIHLSINGDTTRFTATNGRLLAVLALTPGDVDGTATDVLLDGPLFAAACMTLLRTHHALLVRVLIDRNAGEARLTRGTAVAIVRLVDLVYPRTAGVLDRFRGQGLVPAVASFAPALVVAAQRIAGAKAAMMFWSPCPDGRLARCWSRASETEATISTGGISALLSQPGIWSDGQLLILLMPVTRVSTGAPELTPFLEPVTPVATVPAPAVELADTAA